VPRRAIFSRPRKIVTRLGELADLRHIHPDGLATAHFLPEPELWRRRCLYRRHRPFVGLAVFELGGGSGSEVFSIDDCAGAPDCRGGLGLGSRSARSPPWYRTFFGRGSVNRPTGSAGICLLSSRASSLGLTSPRPLGPFPFACA
jgi:hypothetical protein